MERMARLSAARLVRWGMTSLGAALLLGIVLGALALTSLGQGEPGLFPPAALAAAPTSRPTPRTSPTAHTTPGKGKGSQSGGGGTSAALPSWLPEGAVALVLVLLVFGLLLVPLALRSARSERKNQPIYKPAARRSADKQVARFSLIPPERKEPLSREQMRALRASRQPGVDSPQQFTGSLEAVHLVSGVPVSPPDAQAEAAPQAPTPRETGAGQGQEGELG